MLTKEDVIEKLRSGELTPQDIAANGIAYTGIAHTKGAKSAKR